MRWKSPASICIGQQRTVHRFLWIPTSLDFEIRWLEFADIVQQRVEWADIIEPGITIPKPGWKNIHWRNK